MNILEAVNTRDQYFGLVKIDLRCFWDHKYAGKPVLNPESFKEYADMRSWLVRANIQHKFSWINSGAYLPDYLWIPPDDTATYFKLKYGL